MSSKGVKSPAGKFQAWDRDIVRLPETHGTATSIPYPRGAYRRQLGQWGLIGKIQIVSTMSELDVQNEVRSVFSSAMDNRSDFPFSYLQSTGAGSKTLTVPSVSSSFCWTANQVAKLGTYKQPIYILAEDTLTYPDCEVCLYVCLL